jgi:tetratricopeptide (TPR) repeat protein
LSDYEGAIKGFDAALQIRPDDAVALYDKIATLLMQEKEEEAIEQLCQAWRYREYLSNKGASLAQLFEYLGKEPEECQ